MSEGQTPAGARDRILRAAAAVLSEQGYAAAQLGAIAGRADLQPPAIYHYFSSREDLIGAVMEEGQRSVRLRTEEALAALGPTATPAERLGAMIEAHLRAALTSCDFARAVTRNAGQLPTSLRPRLTEESETFHRLWRDLLEEVAEAGMLASGIDPTIGRMLAIGSLNWATEWSASAADIDRIVDHARRLLLRGLLQQEAQPGQPTGLEPATT